MIIAVFGATEDTGRLVVEYALDAGHEVRVLSWTPEKILLGKNVPRDWLKVTRGDLKDLAAVKAVLDGANAVIETLPAAPANVPGFPKRDGMLMIVEAMKRCGVKRLIVFSTARLSPEWQRDLPSYLRWLGPFFFKNIDDDYAGAEEVVMAEAGDLQFTILRSPILLLGVPPADASSITLSGSPLPGTHVVPVGNVARALLDFAVEDAHRNQVVHIDCTERQPYSWGAYRPTRALVWANVRRKLLLPALRLGLGAAAIAVAGILIQCQRQRVRHR